MTDAVGYYEDPSPTLAGRRNPLALFMVGVYLLSVGGTVWLDRLEAADPGKAVLYEFIPIEIRLALWFTCGLLAMATAFTRFRHIGWGVALIMPAERALSHSWSFLMYLVPGYPPGMIAAIAYAGWWVSLATLFVILAGWVDLPRHGK